MIITMSRKTPELVTQYWWESWRMDGKYDCWWCFMNHTYGYLSLMTVINDDELIQEHSWGWAGNPETELSKQLHKDIKVVPAGEPVASPAAYFALVERLARSILRKFGCKKRICAQTLMSRCKRLNFSCVKAVRALIYPLSINGS